MQYLSALEEIYKSNTEVQRINADDSQVWLVGVCQEVKILLVS